MTSRARLAAADDCRTDAYARRRRFGISGRSHWYYAAAIAIIIVAAALRFYELGLPLAHYDEAVAALNSGGTLTEVVQNTRADNSAPLLYPLLLWAVQRVDISPFSIRLIPALSGILTVGVILLLPRFGLRRSAALLAAILSTLAPAAIYAARGTPEYGVDALVAALLIAGLLWYRRAGRQALLCAALLVAPLLQYGLILFGIAVIAAGLLLPPAASPQVGLTPTGRPRRERILDWLRRRISLAWPAAFFLAGCVISYLTTLRYQLETAGMGLASGNYYAQFYFWDEYSIIPALEFSITRVWDTVNYHLPLSLIIAVTVAAVICLLSTRAGRPARGNSAANAGRAGGHLDVVATLFALALAIAAVAATLMQYPARPTQHIAYLGPAVFVFSGVVLAAAFHGLMGRMTLTTPHGNQLALAVAVSPANLDQTPAGPSRQITFVRPKVLVIRGVALSLTLAIVAAAMIIGASVVAIRQDNPYQVAKAADFFGILEQSVHTDDIVYVTGSTMPIMSFYEAYYQRQWPDNYIQGGYDCWNSYTQCALEISDIVAEQETGVGDVYVISYDNLSQKLAQYDPAGALESFADFRDARSKITSASLTLYRFPADGDLLHSVRQEWPAVDAAARRRFEVYYDNGRLTYVREPCAPSDTEARFFLHTFTAGSTNALSEFERRHGFANRDFHFAEKNGTLLGNRCVVSVALPDYDLARIRTGQYDGDGRIWQANIAVLGATHYAAVADTPPAARSVFNLHLDGDTLLYSKSPCAPDDTVDLFFLHLTPADLNVLREPWRTYGFANQDFSFDRYGWYYDRKCLISVPLPEYEITGISTGQYADDKWIWQVQFAP